MTRELRIALSEMTEGASIEDHPRAIEELRSRFGHSIEIVESSHPITSYTCAVHAFGLIDDQTYIEVASYGLGRTFAGREFVEFILAKNLLTELSTHRLTENSLAIYLDHAQFRHVGIVRSRGRLLSKWGTGHLYEHPIWEVPLAYGDTVKFFSPLTTDEGLELFKCYAVSHGFTFDAGA